MRIWDAHRHLGELPPFPVYGGPSVSPAPHAPATVDALLADLDAEGTERALVIPNYGVPDPDVAFGLNELCVEAAARSQELARRVFHDNFAALYG